MITLLRIGKNYVAPERKEYLIDGEADIKMLPTSNTTGKGITGLCTPGSLAYTPDLSLIFQLGNDNIWHKITQT